MDYLTNAELGLPENATDKQRSEAYKRLYGQTFPGVKSNPINSRHKPLSAKEQTLSPEALAFVQAQSKD